MGENILAMKQEMKKISSWMSENSSQTPKNRKKNLRNTPTEASTNPKNFNLNKNLNMNLIYIET